MLLTYPPNIGQQLYAALSDGNTVADYNAAIGVTGALNASAWANQIGAAGPLLQATGANQPIVLSWTGVNYLWLPGVNGNTATALDSAAISQTGDQSVAMRVALNDYTPPAAIALFNHDLSAVGSRGIIFYLNTDGKLHWVWSADGTSPVGDKASTAATGLTDAAAAWIMVTFDVDNGASGNDVKFYTAPDSASLPTSWTQLGTTVTTAGATSVFNSNQGLIVGNDGASSAPALGKIYRAVYFSGVVDASGNGGTVVFDANFANVAEGATSFTESSSNAATVTINSTGAKKAQIVGSPSVLFDGVAQFIKASTFTLNQPWGIYLVEQEVSYTVNDYLFDGNTSDNGLIYQTGGTPLLRAYAGVDLIFGAGQSPPLNTYVTLWATFNGASSAAGYNSNAGVTGNAGTNNPAGFTLGSNGNGTGAYANIQVKRVILRNVADSTAKRAQIQSLLKAIYGTP